MLHSDIPTSRYRISLTACLSSFDHDLHACPPAALSSQVDPLGDLNTAAERALGALVKAKYGTDFYILHRCEHGLV